MERKGEAAISTSEYLSYTDIERITGVRKSTLRVWLTRGKLPAPDYMPNRNAPLWDPKTIEAWNEERLHRAVPAD